MPLSLHFSDRCPPKTRSCAQLRPRTRSTTWQRRKAPFSLASLARFARRNCEEAEAQAADRESRNPPFPGRGRAVPAPVAPAPAPDHPGRALLGGSPLPDVAVQVVDTQRVRQIQAHLAGALQVWPLGRRTGGFSPVEVGLRAGKVVGRLVEVEAIRTFFLRYSPSSTDVFPFLLGRQAVSKSIAGTLLVQLLDETLHGVPGDAFHRVARVAREMTGVVAHHRVPFRLRYRVDAAPQPWLQSELVRPRLAVPAAQPAIAGRHPGELHAELVGDGVAALVFLSHF